MEDESLSKYLRAKLGIRIQEYCDLVGEPIRTIKARWTSEKGRERVKDNVFCIYVRRFDKL